jgi:hypothetical protein
MLNLDKCAQIMKVREMKDYELDEIISGRIPKGQARWKTYCQSLDAMHDAEKVIESEKRLTYLEYLEHLTLRGAKFDEMISGAWVMYIVHATARQKAEAFVLMVMEET